MPGDALPPIAFLAFANDPARPLDLSREQRTLSMTFQTLKNRGQGSDFYVSGCGEIDGLVEELGQFAMPPRLMLFHYGGHAGAAGLLIGGESGGEVAKAGGLAALFATQKDVLKLVFLNGCGTRPQVAALHASGVPAVIATSRPVEDDLATHFAEQFYDQLRRGATLKQAFDWANGGVVTKASGQDAQLEVVRDMDEPDPAAAPDTPTWGLYLRAGADALLDWRIAEPEVLASPAPDAAPVFVDSDGNRELRTKLVAALRDLPRLSARFDDADRDGSVDRLNYEIIRSFPIPIGEQIRRLLVQGDPDRARLAQLVQTYEFTIQLFTYAALAQLWEVRRNQPDLAIADERRVALSSFLSLTEATQPAFDYFQLVAAALGVLGDSGAKPFMIECSDVLHEMTDAPSIAAHNFMQALRTQGLASVPDSDVAQRCAEATTHVSEILRDVAFIANYYSTAVRTIEVNKYRGAQQFMHQAVPLDGDWNSARPAPRPFNSSTDSRSVLLQRNWRDSDNYLNLTPLVFDENAFLGDGIPKLYFFSHHVPEENRVEFRMVLKPDEVVRLPDPARPHLDPIKGWFEDFKSVVFK